MKVKVVNEFRDKDNFSRLYVAGSIVDFEESRVDSLKELGLVEDVYSSKSKKVEKNDSI